MSQNFWATQSNYNSNEMLTNKKIERSETLHVLKDQSVTSFDRVHIMTGHQVTTQPWIE